MSLNAAEAFRANMSLGIWVWRDSFGRATCDVLVVRYVAQLASRSC